MMDQVKASGPLPFVHLGTIEEREVVFGGVVPAEIAMVGGRRTGRRVPLRDRREFEAFDDADFLKVAALSPPARLKFAPYWFAIRIGGGIARKVMLAGIKERAEGTGSGRREVR